MDVVSLYSIANLSWLTVQAVPLIIWPSFIISLLRIEYMPAGDVEEYFARSLGFALLSMGLTVVILSGAIPLTSLLDSPPEGSVSPHAFAAVLIATLHHTAAGFYCNARYGKTDQLAYLFGLLGSAALAVAGLCFLLFAGDRTRLSRKRGLDKDTSGWPFPNRESYRAKKKDT